MPASIFEMNEIARLGRELAAGKKAQESLRVQRDELQEKIHKIQPHQNNLVRKIHELEGSLPSLNSRIGQGWNLTIEDMSALLAQKESLQKIL